MTKTRNPLDDDGIARNGADGSTHATLAVAGQLRVQNLLAVLPLLSKEPSGNVGLSGSPYEKTLYGEIFPALGLRYEDTAEYVESLNPKKAKR